MLAKYKGSEAAVIAAAGRTDPVLNTLGASALAGGLNALLNQPDCGCD